MIFISLIIVENKMNIEYQKIRSLQSYIYVDKNFEILINDLLRIQLKTTRQIIFEKKKRKVTGFGQYKEAKT